VENALSLFRQHFKGEIPNIPLLCPGGDSVSEDVSTRDSAAQSSSSPLSFDSLTRVYINPKFELTRLRRYENEITVFV
jgi:hypothetical protein